MPDQVSPLESMGFSVANKMIDGVFNGLAAKKAYERQKDLMKMQNDINVQNWHMQNAYSTPKAQKQRLMEAGLNPDMMYGQQGVSGSFASVPGASAPGAPMANMGTSSTATDAATLLLSAAQAKEAGAKAEGQQLDNEYLRKTMEDRVKQIAISNNWTEEQTVKISQEVSMIVGQQNALREQIENMKTQRQLTQKEVDWFDRHMKAEINDLKASAAYHNACASLTESQKELLDSSMDNLVKITGLQADQLETMVGLLNKYGDAQAIVGMATQVISAASDLIEKFLPHKVVKEIVKGVKN